MADIAKLKDKLRKANYLVTCNYNSKENEYVLTTPQSVELNKIQTIYKIIPQGIYIKMTVGDNEMDDSVKVPAYAISSIIMSDMIFKCNSINYNLALIHFTKDNTEVTEVEFFNSMPIKYRKGDEEKSIILRNLITAVLLKNMDEEKAVVMAKSYGVTAGYNLSLKILGYHDDNRESDSSEV